VVSSDCCYSSAGVGKRGRGEVLVEPSPLWKSVLVMNKDCSQSTLRAHTSSSRAHASASFPTVFDPASPAQFFTRTRVLTCKERQSIFQDWGSDAVPVVRGLDSQWSKKTTLARSTSILVRSDASVVFSWSCTTRIHYVGTTSGRVLAREDRWVGTAFHPAPVTDGCKRRVHQNRLNNRLCSVLHAECLVPVATLCVMLSSMLCCPARALGYI